ncbi:MAG: type II toxin-antitoxin system HicA family toxin [Opitutaceae bacterium]|jgi:predicted RNA binding protein YcfA (HicA-like mRNA interferase family)|nr:type II toxin-antitoxin system HicA family toxin [Opitutaceae bacterium]
MPRKLRELIADLRRAGFEERPGKGSHRRFYHAASGANITLSGHNEGVDAHRYQERQLKDAMEKSKR